MKRIMILSLMAALVLGADDLVVCDSCGHAVARNRSVRVKAKDHHLMVDNEWSFRTFCEKDAPKCEWMELRKGDDQWHYYRSGGPMEVEQDGSIKGSTNTISTGITTAKWLTNYSPWWHGIYMTNLATNIDYRIWAITNFGVKTTATGDVIVPLFKW